MRELNIDHSLMHTSEERKEKVLRFVFFTQQIISVHQDGSRLPQDPAHLNRVGQSATVHFGQIVFAGQHQSDEPKSLTPIDVSVYKKGFLSPDLFLGLFADLADLGYLGKVQWTEEYVQRVRDGLVEGITFEGVVGKAGGGHKRVMVKAKTQAWIDKVIEVFGHEKGLKLVNS